jgi:prepilin-type processing-associated H-X9-DG protein
MAAAREPINSRFFTGDVRPATGTTDARSGYTRLFGSFHPGGCHFLRADGSVLFVSNSIPIDIYQSMGIRDDGNSIGGLEL